MKKFLLLVFAFVAVACTSPFNYQPKKPFVIVQKQLGGAESRDLGYLTYTYTDANGTQIDFEARDGEYRIGDTIR